MIPSLLDHALQRIQADSEFDGRLVTTIAVDRDRAPLVKWAFEAYATGDYSMK